jgi:hypothetical protein
MKILIIVGLKTITIKDLGSSKDILTRSKLLTDNGHNVKFLKVPNRNDIKLLSMLQEEQLSEYDAILFEHTRYPKSLRYLKKHFPKIKRLVRTHNAEFLHGVDKIKALINTYGFKAIRRPIHLLKLLYRAIRSLYLDIKCASLSNVILSCNEIESDSYWSLFKDKKSIYNVNTYTELYNVLFMGSILPTEFNDNGFKILSDELKISQNQIKFNVTGAFSYFRLTDERVNIKGIVKDYINEMANNDIVCIPSPYGYGIKTRIYEGLYLGKKVFVHKKIHQRLPLLLRRNVFLWSGRKGTLLEELKLCIKPQYVYPTDDLKQYVKNSNHEFLSSFNM